MMNNVKLIKILVKINLRFLEKNVPLYRVLDGVLPQAAHWLLVLVLLIMWLV